MDSLYFEIARLSINAYEVSSTATRSPPRHLRGSGDRVSVFLKQRKVEGIVHTPLEPPDAAVEGAKSIVLLTHFLSINKSSAAMV